MSDRDVGPAARSWVQPLVRLASALIIAAAILGAAWIMAHPDATTRCAISGGTWQEDVGKCLYPVTSHPLFMPPD